MKILVNGKVYTFRCEICGCRFQAAKGEIIETPERSGGFEPSERFCECPCCGNRAREETAEVRA